MPAPDRIERTMELAHPPQRVWEALTTADALASWFGSWAEIDLRPGGELRMRWDDAQVSATLSIKVVEPPRRFAYTWGVSGLPADDPRRTYVEFTLEPTGKGTRLTLVESGFAQIPNELFDEAYHGNVDGWAQQFASLAAYLDAAA